MRRLLVCSLCLYAAACFDSSVPGEHGDTNAAREAEAEGEGSDADADADATGEAEADGEDAEHEHEHEHGEELGSEAEREEELGSEGEREPEQPIDYDCTPTEPATEICDGLDNDCDGVIDPAMCSWGEVCLSDDNCVPELFCSATFTSGFSEDFCSDWCYASYPFCPTGFACDTLEFTDGLGLCESFGQGAAVLGEACVDWSDCGSTWCHRSAEGGDDRCQDRCTSARHCNDVATGEDMSCTLFAVNHATGGTMFAGLCATAPTAGKDDGQSCGPAEPCLDGLCLSVGGQGHSCSRFCCASTECAPGRACRIVHSSAPDFPRAVLKGCAPAAPLPGSALGGADCTSDADCRSGACDLEGGSPGFCLDLCCTDADCAAGAVCSPAFVESSRTSLGLVCQRPGNPAPDAARLLLPGPSQRVMARGVLSRRPGPGAP